MLMVPKESWLLEITFEFGSLDLKIKRSRGEGDDVSSGPVSFREGNPSTLSLHDKD